MPSDSGASSLGHTGRPSMWNSSSQRKLSRLYTYTRLTFGQMQRVLAAVVFGDNDCPGKDSINKKLSTNFDKEPRWLRPKTDTDMDRRLEQLANSPTRRRAPDHLFTTHSRAASSSVSSHNTLDQLIKDEQTTPNLSDFQTNNHIAPTYWSAPLVPLPAVSSNHVAFAAAWGPAEPSMSTAPHPFSSAEGLLRRSTVMTNSTDMTYSTVQQALAECPEALVKKINKLMKRFTIPMATHNENEDSPFESRPASPDLNSRAWDADDDEERLPDDERPLPGDLLRLDLELLAEGVCLGEASPEHRNRSCYCDARDAESQEHWVFAHGIASHLIPVLLGGLGAAADSSARDPYGNSLLHLLAARDVSHQVLERAIDEATNVSATNSADQSFIHLLGTSWFTAPAALVHLLQKLDRDGFDIYARDVYGKSVFHIIEDKIQDSERPAVESILRHFQRDKYYLRDAFGCFPGRNLQAPPTLRIDTSFITPPPQLDRQVAEDENYHHQARLLEFIREAHEDPAREDLKGRNALHCLADVILSEDTLKAQYGALSSAGPSMNPAGYNNDRKRKFRTPFTNKELCDSSKTCLNFRLRLVQSLLQAGVDANHYAADGTTPLMAFVLRLPEDGDYKVPPAILEHLIQGGANVNARNRKGETALHVAARSGRKLAVRILVQNGANVSARDASGRSVLDVLDTKVMGTRRDQKANAHYEACRAWLSGKEGMAVQDPTIVQEWGWTERL